MAKRMSGKECLHSFSRVSKPKEPTNKIKNLAAFTLAEVLITLAIIGVVAALTIPTVITNYQKKMYVTQLKKSYNNLTNGFKTMIANDGVTKLSDTTLWSKIPSEDLYSDDILQPKNAEFLKEFSKNFKVVGVYGKENIPEEYNIKFKNLDGEDVGPLGSAIYLADGTFLYFSLIKTPYVASCGTKECSSLKEFQETRNTKTKMYTAVAELYLDVNGVKGPNVAGRDLFIFFVDNYGTLYPVGGADYVVLNHSGCKYDDLESCGYYWKNEESTYPCSKSFGGAGCTARIMEEGWEMRY